MFEVKKNNVHKIVESKEQVEAYKAKGYVLLEKEEIPKKTEEIEIKEETEIDIEENQEPKDLDDLKLEELKELAKEHKVKGYTTMNKGELVESLKELV